MSKIARYQGNVRAFASDAQGLERTVFGGTNQADDLTSQITASFLRGWGIVGASEHPSLEDFNAAMYAMSQFIAYQHQMGVPEWHSEQEYHIGSMCTYNGESYQSLQNANVGSQPPSAKWTPVLTSKNGLSNLQLRESFSGVVGQSRNARMSVAAASATATFSADELIVEDSVGRQYRVTSFSKVINLATTGAGGMDTGVVPATGFVALYVIYNPTTGTSALLAVDTTSTAAPEIYGGANMPAGFTASALVSIWRVVSGKFIVGEQRGRDISIIDVNAVTTTTTTSSLTAISVASAIPKNAKSVAGWAGTQSTGSSTVQSVRIAGSVQIVGMRLIQVNSATAINAPYTLPILTEQTIYYSNETSGTLVSAAIFINEYSF
nr:hypothetical protein [Citrobacter freundii]